MSRRVPSIPPLHRRRFLGLTAAGAAALAVSLPNSPGVDAQRTSGTVTVGLWQEPSSLNPHLVGTAPYIGYYAYPILEGLAQFDVSGELVPRLAAEIPTADNGGVSADGLTVTYKLRPDVTWSDGQPFTADDVVYTYQYLTDPQIPTVSGAKYRSALANVEAVDPTTVRLTFKQLYAAWPLLFNGLEVILPKHVVGASPDPARSSFNQKPIGTGPFKVDTYTPGDQIRYVPNEIYRDPAKPLLATLVLKFIPSVEALVEAVKAGAVDVAWAVKENYIEPLSGDPNLTLVMGPVSPSERILLNLADPKNPEGEGSTHPVLGDVRVRRAIELAIDKQTIVDQLMDGVTSIATTVFSIPEWAAPTVPASVFDPTQAAALLDEAEWTLNGDVREKDGVRAVVECMTTSGDALREQMQLVIRQNLADIGIQVNINNLPAGVFFGVGDRSGPPNKGNFDMAIYANGPDPDPQAYMTTWSCDAIGTKANNYAGNFNWSRYCSPDYEALLVRATSTLDRTARKGTYQQMAELLDRDKPSIFLFNRLVVHAKTNNVNGLVFNPWTDVTWNVEDWTVSG
jgi:peptide/nickel transport system substrate-binding protein